MANSQRLRLLCLYDILLSQTDENHRLGMKDLFAALSRYGIDADRRTIYSDISELKHFGLDIVYEDKGYYVASRVFELPELKLLVDAIQCSRFITEKKSSELIRKLESLASVPQAHELQRQVCISGRVKTMNESIYYNIDALHLAISRGVQITFQYFEWTVDFSSDTRVKKRYRKNGGLYEASPWALTWDDENYYLIAYENKNEELRHYRVDKMENISLTELPRNGRKLFENNFDVALYSRTLFGMFSGEEKNVRLLCENRFIGVICDRFGNDIVPFKEDDEHFSVNVTVAVSPQFFSWIFGLGGAVRIAAPEDVRKKFNEQLRSML